MAKHPARRRFLQLTGTGAAASIAGCQALQSNDSEGGGDADGANTASAALSPEQEVVDEYNGNLESGDLNESEAVDRATEILENTRDEVDSIENVSVDEFNSAFGLVLLSGSSDGILAALDDGFVSTLYPGDDYEALIEQQEQVQEQQAAQQEQIEDIESEDGDGGNESGE